MNKEIDYSTHHTCDGQWRYYCEACSGLPDDDGLRVVGLKESEPDRTTRIEYAVRHVEEAHIDVAHNTFDTLSEAIEWVTEREEPDEWRLYERQVTDWEEVE